MKRFASMLFVLLLPLVATAAPADPATHPPGAVIASAHTLATDAGIEVIGKGGIGRIVGGRADQFGAGRRRLVATA